MRAPERSATISGGGTPTHNRVREPECLPSLNPHRLCHDDLEADPIAVQQTAGDVGGLTDPVVKALEPQRWHQAVANRAVDPPRHELELAEDERFVAPPCEPALRVDATRDGRAHVRHGFLVLHGAAEGV